MTRAEWHDAFNGDGQCFKTRDGEQMMDLIERLDLRTHRIDAHDLTVVALDDDTVLVPGGGWDYRHPDCTCGACWADGGEECPGADEDED